jgi:hypothetical protein
MYQYEAAGLGNATELLRRFQASLQRLSSEKRIALKNSCAAVLDPCDVACENEQARRE